MTTYGIGVFNAANQNNIVTIDNDSLGLVLAEERTLNYTGNNTSMNFIVNDPTIQANNCVLFVNAAAGISIQGHTFLKFYASPTFGKCQVSITPRGPAGTIKVYIYRTATIGIGQTTTPDVAPTTGWGINVWDSNSAAVYYATMNPPRIIYRNTFTITKGVTPFGDLAVVDTTGLSFPMAMLANEGNLFNSATSPNFASYQTRITFAANSIAFNYFNSTTTTSQNDSQVYPMSPPQMKFTAIVGVKPT